VTVLTPRHLPPLLCHHHLLTAMVLDLHLSLSLGMI
jgi:hypothetical protein